MRKVFLEDLAKKGKLIDWKGSVGREIRFIYDGFEDTILIKEYVGDQKILLKYKGKEKVMDSYCFKKCNLGEFFGKHMKEYRYEIGEVIKRKTHSIKIIEQTRYQGQKAYRFVCLNCGNENEVLEGNIKNGGVGCNACIPKPTKVLKGVNDISTTAPWMVDYLLDKEDSYRYTKSATYRIKFKCPDCGNIRELTIGDVYQYGFSCDSCNDGYSIPSKFMFNILKEMNVEFITEYSPKWCIYTMKENLKTGRYDFYIPSKRIIIEMDGGFHSKDNTMSGQTKEESLFIDKMKDKLALENNIEVIRIDCNKVNYIDISSNILKSKLTKQLDFSTIDLKKCYKNSQTSKLMQVCNIWNDGEHSIQKISTEMKIDRHTVRTYLKEGVMLGICNYTTDKAMKSRRRLTKPILCINNGIVYNSIKEAIQLGVDHFGVNLDHGTVINVLKKRRESYKSLIFKYISDLTEEEKIKYNITSKVN